MCQKLNLKWDTKTHYVYSQGKNNFQPPPPLHSNRKYGGLIGMPFITSVPSLIQYPISIIKLFNLLHLPPLLHAPFLLYFGCLVAVSIKRALTIEVWSLTFGAHN